MCNNTRRKINDTVIPKLKDKPKVRRDRPYFVHCLFISVAVFTCYLNSLNCGLVFDDVPAIRENKDIRSSTPITNLLSNDFWGTPMLQEDSHKSYRPLCVLSFRINYFFHGLDPLGYHLVNAVLHGIACILYYRTCLEFLPSESATVAALLFAVHPIHTEAVTGVVGRAELLCAVFFLLSFLLYISNYQAAGKVDFQNLFKCFIFTTLSMLSKEQGVSVVAVCSVYDLISVMPSKIQDRAPWRRIKGPTPTWRKDLILRLLLLCLLAIVLLIFRVKVMGSSLPVFDKFDNPAAVANTPTRQLTYNYLLAFNAWLLLFPSELCCDWSMGTIPLITSFTETRNLGTLIFYVTLFIFLWKSYYSNQLQHQKTVIISISLIAFPFIPASNLFFPVGFVIAERLLYLPSMGFCLLVAYGWHRLMLASSRRRKCLLKLFVMLTMCLHFFKTVRRNLDWKTDESLFESGLQVTTKNAKLYSNLGHAMEARGETLKALQYFIKATEIQPDDIGAYLNVGKAYNSLGMADKAEEAFWKAKSLLPRSQPGKPYRTHLAPRHLDLFINLGDLLSQNDSRLTEAEEIYKEAIRMKKDYIQAYLHRANVLVKLNRSVEAQHMYKEALKHDKMNPDIFYNIGVLLLDEGKSEQALVHFDQALRLDPEHEKSLMNYAILSQDTGDSNLRKFAHDRLRSMLNKGRLPERIYFNMGMLSMKDQEWSQAEIYFRKAIENKKDFGSALFNLALLLYERNRPLEAVSYLTELLKLQTVHTKGLMLLGNINFANLRNYTAAKECYELILKNDPVHIPALHNLCASLVQMNQLEPAQTCFEKALEIAPNEEYIKEHLDMVIKYRNAQNLRNHAHQSSVQKRTKSSSKMLPPRTINSSNQISTLFNDFIKKPTDSSHKSNKYIPL